MNATIDLDMQDCIRCAMRNGHTQFQAKSCELYSVACPDCPLVTTEADEELLEAAIEAQEEAQS